MPLLFSSQLKKVHIGLWDSIEDENFFLQHLHLYEEEKKELNTLSDRKKIQWLSSRHLLHFLTNEENRLITSKDNFGKPFLAESNLHISLSHSGNLAAAIVGNFPLGIDIQNMVEKLMRIRTKFLSEREVDEMENYNDLELIHIYWGAKECLFKAYGKGKVDFKKDLYIKEVDTHQKTIVGNITKENFTVQYTLAYTVIHNSVLVYCVDVKTDQFKN